MNWQEHISNYNKLNVDGNVSIRDYASDHGLNYNTARRYLTKKSSDQTNDQVINDQLAGKGKGTRKAPASSSTRATPGGTKKGAARTKAAPANPKKPAAIKKRKAEVIKFEQRGHERHTIDNDWKKGALDNLPVTIEHDDPKPPALRRVRSGIHQKLTQMDIEGALKKLQDGWLDNLDANLMASALARHDMLLQVHQLATEELQIRIDVYNGVITPDDSRWVDLGDNPRHPMYDLVELNVKCGFALSDAQARISQLAQARTKHKIMLEKHEREMLAVDKEHIDKAYALVDDGTLTPLEAARWLERRGVKPPATLLVEANKELNDDTPPDSDEVNTLDKDQMDKEARAYAEMRRNKDAFLAERRATVAGIVDRGGYGDLDENGQRRDGEGLDEYDDEEFDVEATQKQYLEEDGAEEWEAE